MATNKTQESDDRTGVNLRGSNVNALFHRLTASSIIGSKVEKSRGEHLGTIHDLMINISNEEIEYAVLEFGSFLGIGGKLFAIPFNELKPKPSSGAFILNREEEYLKQSPGFDKEHWPKTNDHYYDDVNQYYKISSEAFIP